MSLESIAHAQSLGNPKKLQEVVRELQGLRQVLVTGAAAGTAMACGNIGVEDTIVSALNLTDLTDDTANITIQSKKASGTITISGNPVADETFVVNGVTYTFKATPAAKNHVKITAGDNTAMATAAAAAINAYEARYEARLNGDGNRAPSVVATSALGVVTVTAIAEGTTGNALTLTENATNVAVSGAGTLAGGSATGSIKSTSALASKKVLVTFFDKR